MKKTSDATYSAALDSRLEGYCTVVRSVSDPMKFTISANALKNNRDTVSGKIRFVCDQNGKKAELAVSIVNDVKKIELGNASNVTLDSSANKINITPSSDAAVSGTVTSQNENHQGRDRVFPACL